MAWATSVSARSPRASRNLPPSNSMCLRSSIGRTVNPPVDHVNCQCIKITFSMYQTGVHCGCTMTDSLTNLLIEFGRWVRRFRDQCDYTQEQLGDLVGVKKAYISNLERAELSSYTGRPSRPDIEIVDKLAAVLGRPIMEARNLAGYGLPEGAVKTVEDAVNVTLLFDQKGLSDAERETIRPLLQSADRMIELLKHSRMDDTE